MTPLGVAIVGCGAIGEVHAAIASGLDSIKIVAVVDAVGAAATRLADKLAGEGFARPQECVSLEAALAIPEVELVVLTTPSGLHIEQAGAALDARRHVIIEKPLDVNLARARVLSERAQQAEDDGLVVSVISQHRFDTASRLVTEALASEAFGRISSAIASTAWWRPQRYYDSAPWRGTWQMDGGGALMNQSIHNVDLLLSFLGRPTEVSGHIALLAHERIEVEDSATATISFETGAVAALHATTAAYPGLSTRLQLMGSLGSAVIEDDQLSYYHVAAEAGIDVGPMGLRMAQGNRAAEMLATTAEPEYRLGFPLPAATDAGQYRLDPASHQRQYEDVLRAIRTGETPQVTIRDAFTALALVQSVYISATLRRPILFDDVLAGDYDNVDIRITGDL
ncbi:MAG: UDP-N-acetyl-2-amino-2-deoxyglucuronate dehydrogenase [Subtercola sp.]|nr:UDP-N-acetyl-2-amino-2-deoxyglucuronate dehydrogenase [Subtercola sp.]